MKNFKIYYVIRMRAKWKYLRSGMQEFPGRGDISPRVDTWSPEM